MSHAHRGREAHQPACFGAVLTETEREREEIKMAHEISRLAYEFCANVLAKEIVLGAMGALSPKVDDRVRKILAAFRAAAVPSLVDEASAIEVPAVTNGAH